MGTVIEIREETKQVVILIEADAYDGAEKFECSMLEMYEGMIDKKLAYVGNKDKKNVKVLYG